MHFVVGREPEQKQQVAQGVRALLERNQLVDAPLELGATAVPGDGVCGLAACP